MKQIVIINAHWNNRGDEAAIRAILDSLLEHIADVRITVVFKEKGEISQFPYTGNVSCMTSRFLPNDFHVFTALLFGGKVKCSTEIKKIMQVIRKADCVIYAPGGAVISDRFWWKKQLEYLFPIAFAEKEKIPVFFAAPSVGPFRRKKRFRNSVLKKADKLCVREELSGRELEQQGIKENVAVTIDSAFLNTIDQAQNQILLEKDQELNRFLHANGKIVGITVTDFSWHVEYGKNEALKDTIRDTFAECIDWLGKKGFGILLIPQLFGNQNDRKYLETLQTENTFLLSDEYDAYFQQHVISKLYAVIGMRYHSNIFAAKMGVPFIPVIYEEKMEGFVVNAEWQSASVNLKDLSADRIKNRFIWLEEHYNELGAALKEKHIFWKHQAEQTEREMLKVVENRE